MDKFLHVVSLDVPYPPNYGGVIDIYYKLKALKQLGINVILHCFSYGRAPITHPEKICSQIYYYPRETGFISALSRYPYIVYSRRSPELLCRLREIEAPILFEGLHCCHYLSHPTLKNRQKIVRCCNVEHDYYRRLAKATFRLSKKAYFFVESRRLKRFEPILLHADILLAISLREADYFRVAYPSVETVFIPGFHGFGFSEKSVRGETPFFLFHGNLAVAENEEAALHLISLADRLEAPLIIAGSNPSTTLRKYCTRESVTLQENPSEEQMQKLIQEASAHLLITHQPTGMKLKLLHALYQGNTVIVNPAMVEGTGLEKAVTLAQNDNELVSFANRSLKKAFDEDQRVQRKKILFPRYDDDYNAGLIAKMLWPE